MSLYDRSLRIPEYLVLEVPYPHRGWSTLLPINRTPSGAAYTLENCEIHFRRLQKRWGISNFGTATNISGRLQRIVDFVSSSGSRRTVAIGTTGMWSYESGTWTTRASGKSGGADIIPWTTAFRNKIIVANGSNKLYKWDGVSSSATEITDSPVAFVVGNLGGHVLVGNVAPYGSQVRWSDYLNEDNWTTGSSGSADLIDTDDTIVAFAPFRDMVLALRKRSIWGISVGDSVTTFRFDRLYEGVGPIAPGSVASTPVGVLFLGPDDIYAFSGASAEPLLPPEFSLRRVIEDQLTLEGLRRSVAVAFPARGQYWVSVPLSGSDEVSHVLVVDYVGRTVLQHSLAACALGVVDVPTGGSGMWNDFPVTWSSLQVPWSQLAPTLRQRLLMAVTSAPTQPAVYTPTLSDNGEGIVQKWCPGLFNMSGQSPEGSISGEWMKVVHRLRVMGEAGSNPFSVRIGYSLDGETVTWTQPATIDTTQREWVYDPPALIEAPWWTFEITQSAVNQGTRISSVMLYYTVSSPQKPDVRAWTAV